MKQVIVILFCCVCSISYAQDKPQLVTTTGHQGRVESISFSSNGRYLASVNDKTLKIYDLVMQMELNSILLPTSNSICQVKFSSDNKYIFALAISELFTISHPGGEIIHNKKIKSCIGTKDKACIADNDKIYFASEWDGVTVYDPVKGEVEKKMNNIKLKNILYLSKYNSIVGRGPDLTEKKKQNLYVYNSVTGEQDKSIRIEGGSYGKLLMSDKSQEFVAFEVDSGRVKFFNAKTFAQISEVVIKSLSALEFYPDSKKIIAASYENKMRIFDVVTGKKIREFKSDTLNEVYSPNINSANCMYDMEFSPNGKLLAIPYEFMYLLDGAIHTGFRIGYYNVSDMKLRHKYDGHLRAFRSLILSNDESKMITLNHATPHGSKVWDLKKGEIEQFYSGSWDLKLAGDILALNYFDKEKNKNFVRVYKFSMMKLLHEIPVEGYVGLEISPDGKYIAGMSHKFTPDKNNGLPETKFLIWSSETGKEIVSKNYGTEDKLRQFKFNKKDQLLFFDGMTGDTCKVYCIDPSVGKVLNTFSLGLRKKRIMLEFDQSGDEIFFFTDNNIKFFELQSININTGVTTTYLHEDRHGGPLVMKFNHDYSRMAFFLYDHDDSKNIYKVFVYDWTTKQKIKEIKGLDANICNIDYGKQTGSLYLGDWYGVVTVIGSDYEKKATFFTQAEKDYLILTADNYYKTSITNTQGIGFRYKDELFRFDQFDLRYNRPDLVLESLGLVTETQVGLYKDAWLKRLKRLGYDEQLVNTSSIHAPEISVVGKDNLPYSTPEGIFKFTINSVDTLYDLQRVALYINNVPVYGKNGFTIPGKGIRKYKKDIEVNLEEGKNKIMVSVFNSQGVESTRESFTVECMKKFPKPDLYIFAIGVSKYKDSTMNLTYSDKDVRDVVSVFTENNKKNLRYANVFVKVLTNQEATVANVNAAYTFLKNSKPNDQVILFFSGHGLIDHKLDYYLAMHDVDFTNPSGAGLLYTNFQDFFDGLQSRKRLLLIDACHSGEFDKEDHVGPVLAANTAEQFTVEKEFQFRGKKVIGIGNANELMKELFTDIRKETGATVIASSSGTEYSVESPTWKNGVFTYALKEGLSDMKADRNKDKQITLTETREYLIQTVRELTGGRQNPTTRQENIEFDYRLW